MTQPLRKITIDDIYLSPLKRKRIRREDGSEYMQEISKEIRPCGCFLLEAVAGAMAHRRLFSIGEIAGYLQADVRELSSAIHLLTGMLPNEFLNEYRLREALEWLRCTDLSIGEIARRGGWKSGSTFSRKFSEKYGVSPADYRYRNQYRDFRHWFEWE